MRLVDIDQSDDIESLAEVSDRQRGSTDVTLTSRVYETVNDQRDILQSAHALT